MKANSRSLLLDYIPKLEYVKYARFLLTLHEYLESADEHPLRIDRHLFWIHVRDA
jgi:hypothetical protein